MHSVAHGFELGMFEISFDKWHLGVVRIIDFAAVAVLLIRFQSVMKPLAIRPLVLMGQAGLQVFCAHLFFCFVGLAIMRDAPMVNGWHEAALVAMALSGMLLTAQMFTRKREGDGGTVRAPRPATSSGIEMQASARDRRSRFVANGTSSICVDVGETEGQGNAGKHG
jgi:hypothetical protein